MDNIRSAPIDKVNRDNLKTWSNISSQSDNRSGLASLTLGRSGVKITRLNPNFSVITESMPNLSSAAVGIFFAHGSRHEQENENGITHLIEHMLFKGTKNKNAQEIANIVERAGAIIDGFTSKETSGIYCRFLATEFDTIVDLLLEIISSPQFDASETLKEKNVISQEIKEAEEDPKEQLFTLLFEALFSEHPISFPIFGKINTIQKITQDDILNYYLKKYLPSRKCISTAGNIDHSALLDRIQKNQKKILTSVAHESKITPPRNNERRMILLPRRDISQFYNIAAIPVFSYHDERRYDLLVLNTILGGASSSRFFQRVREQEGLVYTIYTFVDFFSDFGIWGIHTVSDGKSHEQITNLILDEIEKIRTSGITKQELDSAINFCKGMFVLGAEDPMSRMMRNAKNELILGSTIPIEDSLTNFDNVTLDALVSLINEMKIDRYSAVMVGPIDEKKFELLKTTPSNIKYQISNIKNK